MVIINTYWELLVLIILKIEAIYLKLFKVHSHGIYKANLEKKIIKVCFLIWRLVKNIYILIK